MQMAEGDLGYLERRLTHGACCTLYGGGMQSFCMQSLVAYPFPRNIYCSMYVGIFIILQDEKFQQALTIAQQQLLIYDVETG